MKLPGHSDPRLGFSPSFCLTGAISQCLLSALQPGAVTSLHYTIKQLPGITTGAYRPPPPPACASERHGVGCRKSIPPAGQHRDVKRLTPEEACVEHTWIYINVETDISIESWKVVHVGQPWVWTYLNIYKCYNESWTVVHIGQPESVCVTLTLVLLSWH